MATDLPYLLVFDRGTTCRVELPEQGQVVLGSVEGAQPRWPESSVGPLRIVLEVTARRVTMAFDPPQADIRLNGVAAAAQEALASGDEVTVGEVSFSVHGVASPALTRTPFDSALFKQRLAEEAERFLRYESPFALLIVEAQENLDLELMAQAVCRAVRKVDVVGWLGRTELAVILPETTTAAQIPSNRVLQGLAANGLSCRAGLVICPLDACQPDSLLVGARGALRAAKPGQVGVLADAVKSFEAGGIEAHTADATMVRLFELVRRVSESDIAVLIQGETGAGKEVVAQAVHAWSKRAHGNIVAMNCAAIPENLLESELFGYEKGAFSGAGQSKPGLLEKASGGTLFLDEVGDLSASAQAKLLRVLETGRMMRVGGTQERTVDVRFVSATHRDLKAEASQQKFRLDLYYRISGAALLVPPLRERALDITLLARVFLDKACERLQKPPMTMSLAALRRLSLHPWPGNVRELKNLMEYLAASVPRADVLASDLPDQIAETAAPWMVPARPLPAQVGRESRDTPAAFRNIYEEIEELERTRIRQALDHAGGVKVKAAQLIGMPLRTMLTKMKQYGIENVSSKARPTTR
jgi:two-component system, NtrC family, response regulator AtoC